MQLVTFEPRELPLELPLEFTVIWPSAFVFISEKEKGVSNLIL